MKRMATKHPERKTIVKCLLSGKPFAAKGERDLTCQKIMSWLGYLFPKAPPETVVEIARPSLEAMEAESPDDFLSVDDALRKLERAQDDAQREIQAKAEEKQRWNVAITGINKKPANDNLIPNDAKSKTALRHNIFTAADLAAAVRYQGCSIDELRQMVVISPTDMPNMAYVLTPSGHRLFTHGQVTTVLDQLEFPPEFYSFFSEDEDDTTKRKSVRQILADLTLTVPRTLHDATILRARYESISQTWCVPCARPRTDLTAGYDAQADEWIELIAGKHDTAEKLRDYLAVAMDLSRLLPAIVVVGAKNAGKTLLGMALARLWHKAGPLAADRYWQSFNSALERCPVLLADERGPQDNFGRPIPSTEIRSFLTRMDHTLNTKFGSLVSMKSAIRLVYAANELEALNLVEDGVDEASRDAIAERFLLLTPGAEAVKFLASVDTYKAGWIEDREVLPRLFKWYTENRKVSSVRVGKFCVPGNASDIVDRLSVQSTTASLVLDAVLRWVFGEIRQPIAGGTRPIIAGGGSVYIKSSALLENWGVLIGVGRDDARRTKPTEGKLAPALKGVCDNTNARPIGHHGARYWRIRLSTLLDYAEQCGRGGAETKARIDLPIEELEKFRRTNQTTFPQAVAAAPTPAKEAN